MIFLTQMPAGLHQPLPFCICPYTVCHMNMWQHQLVRAPGHVVSRQALYIVGS